jgi:hypothetical protein
MKEIVKRAFITLGMMSALFVPMLAPAAVYAQGSTTPPNIQQGLCTGSNLNTNDTTCAAVTGTASDSVNTIIKTVINIFSLVVGVVSVIMIIIGGLKYITSGGDSGNVSGAKNTILYAIIGLVIVALAQVIVQFVLGKVSGTT